MKNRRSIRSRITLMHLWGTTLVVTWGNLLVDATNILPEAVHGVGSLGGLMLAGASGVVAWAVKDTIPTADLEQRKVEKFEEWLYDHELPTYTSRVSVDRRWAQRPVQDLPDNSGAETARLSYVRGLYDPEKLEEELDYAFGRKQRPAPTPEESLRLSEEALRRAYNTPPMALGGRQNPFERPKRPRPPKAPRAPISMPRTHEEQMEYVRRTLMEKKRAMYLDKLTPRCDHEYVISPKGRMSHCVRRGQGNN